MDEVKAPACRRSLDYKLNWDSLSCFTEDFERYRPSCPISACRGNFGGKIPLPIMPIPAPRFEPEFEPGMSDFIIIMTRGGG